jgi:hypothetical protein
VQAEPHGLNSLIIVIPSPVWCFFVKYFHVRGTYEDIIWVVSRVIRP